MTAYATTGTGPRYVREDEDAWLGQLARAARAGDRAARDTLWQAVGPRLTRIANRIAWGFPTLERDDALQESFPIFITLVMGWPGPGERGTGFATYLFGMFRWRLFTRLRAYERQRAITDVRVEAEESVAPPPSTPVAWHEYGIDLPAFVTSLPPREREIFLLRVREGLRVREVAARLGLADRTVSRHYGITLRRLRALVK